MGHPLRWFAPGVVYEITTRTIQERFLLRPSAEARELVLGVIGRGATLYPAVAIHGFAFLSNHYHLLASSDDGAQLAAFVGYLNSNVARELGRRHAWRGPFWGRRQRAIPVLDDAAVEARLKYLLAHGVKEGLVEKPQDWPGATSTAWLLGQPLVGTWIHRDIERRTRGRPCPVDPATYTTRYHVELTPIPSWRGLTRAEIAARVRAMIAEVIADGRAARPGPVAGARAALSLSPHDAPSDAAKRPAPICHASTPEGRGIFRAAYRAFVEAFRAASAALRSGTVIARDEFPAGSFPPALAFIAIPAPAAAPWSLGAMFSLRRRGPSSAPR